ncbi:hypothetical protein [Flavivirga spongiicola]|uniref:DUF7151 domain-containing protein n=1 Tax=Flavivirga spongiicola TaxID=421621 RepID=A0ABU7XPF2_9FLAO|nr:hypothetical protein [Flavivirga sp. MEBiC05379]MDO5981411.1 hypothetical protein [Flavivirga sp. MEBiC05379]
MKRVKLFYLITIVLFISCEGEEGTQGLQGNDGINSLINISDEISGSNCENGGLRVEAGLDSNSNGILENNEIQNTKYVCNGINGSNSLITVISEPKGQNCENGGIRINSGIDANNNNILDESEIMSSAYICNGIDGNISLTKISNEDSGVNCENGGLKIYYGIDSNNDGVLNDNEVQYTTYTCNGLNGNLSLTNITDEAEGTICENGGVKIESGVDSNRNELLDENEINITKYVCNGIDGVINEEIRLKVADGIGSTANTSSSIPIIVAGITFNKSNFENVGSIFFESDPYVGNSSNYASLELYNITDNVAISNTLIRTNNTFNIKENLITDNIIDNLPENEIVLGIRLSSEIDGEFSASGIPYLVIKRSN